MADIISEAFGALRRTIDTALDPERVARQDLAQSGLQPTLTPVQQKTLDEINVKYNRPAFTNNYQDTVDNTQLLQALNLVKNGTSTVAPQANIVSDQLTKQAAGNLNPLEALKVLTQGKVNLGSNVSNLAQKEQGENLDLYTKGQAGIGTQSQKRMGNIVSYGTSAGKQTIQGQNVYGRLGLEGDKIKRGVERGYRQTETELIEGAKDQQFQTLGEVVKTIGTVAATIFGGPAGGAIAGQVIGKIQQSAQGFISDEDEFLSNSWDLDD
jgi:hypothetical protein